MCTIATVDTQNMPVDPARTHMVLFVCWIICFQSRNGTNGLSPEVASILAAYLRNTHLRDPYHPSPATITARDQSTREVGGVFKE